MFHNNFFRSNETEEARKKRMVNDKDAQKKRYDEMSPNSKKMKNQKRSENRRLKKAKKISNEEVNVVSVDDITPIIEEPQTKSKLSEYELIRERNITERKKLFKSLGFDKLKEASKPVSKK